MENKNFTVSNYLANEKVQKLLANVGSNEIATSIKQNAIRIQTQNPDANGLAILMACIDLSKYQFARPDDAYVYMYGSNLSVVISYKGYKELAMRTGLYKQIDAREVLDCDKVYRDRETGQVKVEFEEDFEKAENAKLKGFYAYAIATDGTLTSVYMSKEKINAHRDTYSISGKGGHGIWQKNYVEMAKKTVIKKLVNSLPASTEMAQAIKADQLVYDSEGNATYADNPQNRSKTPVSTIKNRLVEADVLNVSENGEVLEEPKEDKKEE